MEEKVTTFYAVRVIRHYADGRPSFVRWVAEDRGLPGSGSSGYDLNSLEKALRFNVDRKGAITKAKRCLTYACVKEALKRTQVEDREAFLQRLDRLKAKYGENRWQARAGFIPMLKVRHEVELVKLTERINYDEPEIIDSLPKRSALEQIARVADENRLEFSRPT